MKTLADISLNIIRLGTSQEIDLVARRVEELVNLLLKPRESLTRNQIARLAGVASTSIKTALDAGKSTNSILFPNPKAKTSKTSYKLTPEQIAAIKAAGIEI